MKRLVTVPLGLAATLVLSAPATAAVYGGETARLDPISITLAKNGQVKRIGVMWTASCNSGQTYDFGAILTAAKKRPSFIGPGDFPLFASVKKGSLRGTALSSVDFGDRSGAISEKFSGRLKPTKATGTWSAHMDVLDGGGNRVDSCDTGTIRWVAHRGPTVYAGSTTQGDPVVVVTTKSRAKVDYFGFGWRAGCTPDDFWHLGEGFGNFPMTSNGAFGDSFTNDYPFQDNSGKNSFTYKINGTLKKRAGSGTLSVHLAATDANGATTETCDTNSVRWSVTQ